MNMHGKLFHKIITIILFAVYVLALCYFLFFAENFGRSDTSAFHYNFVPLKEISRYLTYYQTIGIGRVILNLLGNVIAFIPMGMLLPMMFSSKMKGFTVILLSLELSIVVEVLQLFTRVGSCDVDDVILNTLGGIVGYIIYCIGRRVRSVRDGSKT